ncbi:MAG: hypothetical protein U1F53_11255 [Burkholderiaceae bacterium]
MWVEAAFVVLALGLALSARPWRSLGGGGGGGGGGDGLPWPWLAWWACLPLLWCADVLVHMPIAQPLSGACLLMLMAGWPLAVLALVPVALIAAVLGGLGPAEALARLVWLGVLPATLAFGLGAAVRRWLPHHLFVYILGRGFFASLLALALSGWLALAWRGAPEGTQVADLFIGRWLAAWGDAFLTGMMVAIFVALRPQWLATYSDRLYLPRP